MKAFLEMVLKDRRVQALTLLLTALLLVNGGFYLFRAKPASAKASELETELQNNRQAIKAKQNDFRLYASFGRGKEQIQSFKKLLPAKTDYTAMLRKMFMMAKEDGIMSKSIATEKKEVEHRGDFVQIRFSMPVSGSYKDVRKYISDVENSSLFLNIDNLGLVGNEQTDDVVVNIGLSTYVRSDER